MIVTLAASAVVAGLVISAILAFAVSQNRGVQYVRGAERRSLPDGAAAPASAGGPATTQQPAAVEADIPAGGTAPATPESDVDGDPADVTDADDWPGTPLAPLVAAPREAPDGADDGGGDGGPRRDHDPAGRRAVPVSDVQQEDEQQEDDAPRPVSLVKFDAAGRTNAGNLGENADAYLIQEKLIALADGVAWGAESRWAAALALGAVVADQAASAAPGPDESLRDSLEFANAVLRDKGVEVPELRGMAAALDVVVLAEVAGPLTSWALVCAHIGSGSVYLFPSPGEGEMLTTPQSVGADPIVRAVGAGDHVTGDVESTPVRPGALVVLASNGLTEVLSFPEIQAVVGRNFHAAPHVCAEVLLRLAYRNGPKDDVTVVVARVVRVTGYVWGP
ncbi:hypothetical protein Pth03_21410 [Planotetraspora thailandica]|uniref:PPM-type phosphatase domain-containing protein n=1 Tax=Planotetraspora thailandica TaxID=487172 RepID=A0A8J3XSY4_9ACTN|nr:SpoIIE family protein phosphatase [Planotetraspora thailandica]GII53752.1 hypothetical protein Pth03_21410 [Planotetraspora thailandica]